MRNKEFTASGVSVPVPVPEEMELDLRETEELCNKDRDCDLMAMTPQEQEDFEPPSKRGKTEFEPPSKQGKGEFDLPSKQRKGVIESNKKARFLTETTTQVDDGFAWRKYGQKEILSAKYPRHYYRCTHRHSQGCCATKQVQKNDEGNTYSILYLGLHSCSTGIIASGSTSLIPVEHSFMEDNREREINVIPSKICNYDVTGKIRQEESITSSTSILTESDMWGSSDSMLSTDDRMMREGENETNSTYSCWSKLERDRDSDSWPILKFIGSIDGNLQRLLSAFQDVEVKKIGIYGNGGIGKTTMMKTFLSQYDLPRVFDLVLWVTRPRCSSRRKIQNTLAQQLSLHVQDIKSDDEVAMILLQTLQARKFILFLDDVWEYMDLLKVGIPISSLDNDYKIILTTRSIHVCEAMKVDKFIEAEVLSREQSLRLFRSHAGHVMDSLDIEPYGRAIVNECYGLPLVIKVVGRALSMDNSVFAWKHALKEILLTNTLEVLKIGYSKLRHDMRSCFLYSALFTESEAVRISSLVECLVDEGCVAGSISDARIRGNDIIKQLVDIALLECTDDGSMVEMHGLICDLALVILSDVKGLQMLLSRYLRSILPQKRLLFNISNPTFEEPESSGRENFLPSGRHLSILKAGEGVSEPPSEEEWEEAKMVFLMDNTFSRLPKRPTCSKLLLLFLQRNSSLRAIPSSFFENMFSLQILNLSKTRIKSLPESLLKLECLQVLILRNCERLLFLPSDIGELKNLLVLDVHGTEICQLPNRISELLCLVHLQVCFYGSMDEDECAILPPQLISKGIISNLIQLKELSINVYPGDPRWIMIASDVTTEVSNLKLCSLSFHFPETGHLEYFINTSPAWLHRTLTHFNLIVGHDVKRIVSHVSDDLEHEYNQQDRCLRFVDGDDISDAIRKVLPRATAFYLDHHLTALSITQFGWGNTNLLEFCLVRDCPKLNTIINSTNRTGYCFLSLEVLSIHYCWNLSRLWVGPIRAGTLSMLRRLSVHSCPKLEFIISRPMLAVLVKLEEMIVVDCQSLRSVICNDDTDNNDSAEPSIVDLNSIEYMAEDEMQTSPRTFPDNTGFTLKVLKLHYLPKLVKVWDGGKFPCLESISVYNCPRLRNLDLNSCVEDTLKEVKAETGWWGDLEWDDPALPAKLQTHVKEIKSDDIWGTM
ncbi:hypothetical protein BVRB_3g064600 [Beta vulgaris subsp. vulgaris]|nr:hypothetical protein BVRB_3g064600 [Beta vulgaris subsp. vulgaris]